MCIVFLAHKAHPVYNLILAANRDEYYARPTERAAFWKDAPYLLAGRDLELGGTWLGITRRGRIAAVTNYRDPAAKKENAPSRGLMVSDFLRGAESPEKYLRRLSIEAERYNGFNLIAGDRRGLYYFSNRGEGFQELEPGLYGLSNHLLDTPWPKVERGKRALKELLHDERLSTEAIFRLLDDRTVALDECLPETGVGLEIERMLSPLFITSPVYGTRSSTVLLIDGEEHVTFIERTFDEGSNRFEETTHKFVIEAESVQA